MKYLSVCSGIEAASVAWKPLGWEAVAFSEIEPFPCSVLAHHYPGVPNWGDMTQWESWPDAAVDVLVGGTPCQSFSVAGRRAGMDDPRGQLALAYAGIAARYRPRYIVWENVPGVLSSGGGCDFGSFLRALVDIGYSCAWRVLDAQYFGLAQRRKRVFVVGCFGDWRRAAAVLFESPSLRRDTPPSREKGEGFAAEVAPCIDGSYGRLQGISGQDLNHGHGHLIAFPANLSATQCAAAEDLAPSMGAKNPTAVAFDTTQITSKANYSNSKPGDPCHPLAAGAHPPAVAIGTDCYNGAITGDVAATIGTTGSSVNASGPTVMAFKPGQSAAARSIGAQTDVACTLEAGGGGNNKQAIATGYSVRRLTPKECERLQGFPDDYTQVPHRKKLAADGPRYKALGNSMAVPCMRWIGERIQMVEEVAGA